MINCCAKSEQVRSLVYLPYEHDFGVQYQPMSYVGICDVVVVETGCCFVTREETQKDRMANG